jgi:methylated-DNA-[protein]-cysteine S-methyltransferase
MMTMNRLDPLVQAYAIIDSPLGLMAVGARNGKLRGVILPRPGKVHPDTLIARVWPSARTGRQVLPDLVLQVHAYWRGHPRVFRIDLDLEGFPPFFCRVWRAAARIPPGQVRTYGQVAATVGAARSARAVGGAMAANPFPLIVPCHRVVAASGMGGYSAPGGLHLKKALLDWERTCCRRAARRHAAGVA